MNEQLEARIHQRMQSLYRYTNAMESGDSHTLAAILQEAEQDSVLERMLVEINEVYQIEDSVVTHPDDVVLAQEMLVGHFAETVVQPAEVIVVPTKLTVVGSDKVVGTHALTTRTLPARQWYRQRLSWIAAAVATLLITLAVLPGSSVVAAQFLSLFRPQQFQAVPVVDPQQLRRDFVSYIRKFGDEQVWNQGDNPQGEQQKVVAASIFSRSNLSQSEVEQLTHRQLSLPSHLPDGVGKQTQFTATSGEQGTFIFRSDLTRTYLEQTGQHNVAIPTQLEGASFSIKLDASVITSYYASCQTSSTGNKQCSGGTPFIIAEIPSPVIQATGKASINDLRTFMLSLPKLSKDMRNLLQHIDVNNGIVPIPVPSGINAQPVTVQGVSGLLLSDSSLNALIWQKRGMVHMIGTTGLSSTQVLDAANSLR